MKVLILLFVILVPQWAFAQSQDGVSLGKKVAPSSVTIIFSIGCSHCLDLLDKNLSAFEREVEMGHLRLTLIDVPSLVAPGPSSDASRKAFIASFALQCVAGNREPEAYVDAIEAAIAASKKNVVVDGNWRFGGIAWQNWVHADASHLVAGTDAQSNFVGQSILASVMLSSSQCSQQTYLDTAKSRIDAFKAEHEGVPVLLYNGKIWTDSARVLRDIVYDIGYDHIRMFAQSGISVADTNNGVTVTGIAAGSRWAESGIQIGDVIEEVNTQSVNVVSDLLEFPDTVRALMIISGVKRRIAYVREH